MKGPPKKHAKRLRKGKDALKAGDNKRLAEQRRKLLGKHYASRYRSR